MSEIRLDQALIGDPQYDRTQGVSTLTFFGQSADYVAGILIAEREARIKQEREEALDALIRKHAARFAHADTSASSLHTALASFADSVRDLVKAES